MTEPKAMTAMSTAAAPRDAYGDGETADDVAALIGDPGGPAVIVGTSMAAMPPAPSGSASS